MKWSNHYRSLSGLLLASLLLAGCADAPRLVAEDPESGFAIYRSGRLSPAELSDLCALGVEEIVVLDGRGAERECSFRGATCPGLRVRYDVAQDEDRPVSAEFLLAFGSWVDEARADGRKVAFRCRLGSHRTGRLAAFYRMRFEGVAAADAIDEMLAIGQVMWLHPSLDQQVMAYGDLIAGRPCSGPNEHCPTAHTDEGLIAGRFARDVCATE